MIQIFLFEELIKYERVFDYITDANITKTRRRKMFCSNIGLPVCAGSSGGESEKGSDSCPFSVVQFRLM